MPLVANGPFTADATASLLTVDVAALSPALLPQTDVDLANSVAIADSGGDTDADKGGAQRTAARGGTTGTAVAATDILGGEVDLDSAFASASPPAQEIDDPVLIDVPADPLLNLQGLDAYAEANWVSDTECVASDVPLSLAEQQLAGLTVLDIPDMGSMVTTDPGAASSLARTGLISIPGDNDPRAVQATSTARVAGAHVLNALIPDLDSLLSVDVAVERDGDGNEVPQVTATASGLPGGASVDFADNVVTVTLGGEIIATLDSINPDAEAVLVGFTLDALLGGRLGEILGGTPLDPLVDPLAPILNPLGDAVLQALEALQPIVTFSIPRTESVAADGTSASGSTALLQIQVLPPEADGATEPIAAALGQVLDALGLDIGEPLASIVLGPASAAVTAPAGGITCGGPEENPLELQKVNSGPAIPGSSFDYTIAVGNVSGNVGEPCTMDPVRVVDLLTGPAGSTIELTEPAATVTPVDGGFQIVWDNVGPIEPGGRVTLRIRVNVPVGATIGSNYNDHVETTTTCNGRELEREVDLPLPKVEAPPSGPCNVDGSTKSKSHLEVFPGETFDYFVNVYNGGGEACTGVTVTDALDPRLTFDSCSDSCTVDGRNVTWNLGTLAPGQSVTLWVQVTVNDDATGELTNTAVIDTNETPPKTVTVQGPLITDKSVLAAGDPASTPGTRLARTGGFGVATLAAALGLVALGLSRLRRRIALA